jgi:hypothetical protein
MRELRPRASGVLGIVWMLALTFGCADTRTAEETVLSFQSAVQNEDYDSLYCLSAGASRSAELGRDEPERRANFKAWAGAQYEVYLDGRDRGRVELEDDAIRLVKLFALGRGTFFEFGPRRLLDGGSVRVPARLRFGYARIDLSRLSPGTTFYLNGVPVGTVHPVRVPSGTGEVRLEVLDRLTVEWTLVREEERGECPEGWTVAAASPVEGSEVSTGITWVF